MLNPLRFLLLAVLLSACGSSPQVIVVTATQPPTLQRSSTPIPSSTPLPTATRSPKPTSTRRPTNTPTNTVEPRAATQTSQALARDATRAFNQHVSDIKAACPAIEWVELSEVQYARDHEGDCVYIKGRINNVDLDEGIISIWIGFYSDEIAVGTDLLDNTPGRLTQDMWINVFGDVCTECWITTNRLDGSQTPLPGIQASLIEGPNLLIWVDE